MTYLGIDFGTKRIGLALATDETPPVPYQTLQISDCRLQISEIIKIINKEKIDVVVVGSPRSMRGGEKTAMEKEAEAFVSNLQAAIENLKLTTRIVMEDERLSSKAADALRKEHGASGDRDAVAAMLILESFCGASNVLPTTGTL